MHTWIKLSAALTCVLALGAASRARALTCFDDIRPKRGEVAPRNTRIWIAPVYNMMAMYHILDENGLEVTFSRAQVRLGAIYLDVLTPSEPLRHMGAYRVEDCWGHCNEVTHFTVGPELDLEPPAPWEPEETGSYVAKDEWGATRVIGYAIPAGAIALFDQDGSGLGGPLESGSQLAGWSGWPELSVGKSPCLLSRVAGETANLRFGLLDLAGNFSGFGPTVRFQKPTGSSGRAPDSMRASQSSVGGSAVPGSADTADATDMAADDAGCSVTSTSRGAWLPALLLGLATMRRRKRRAP
jgi:MYXO-CTERM domain-containing protein